MQPVINRKPFFTLDTCCSGLNWLAKKTFNLVIPDDDGGTPPTDFLLMEDDVSYVLLEDGFKIGLE